MNGSAASPLRSNGPRPKGQRARSNAAMITAVRAQSAFAWRQLVFWTFVLLAALGSDLVVSIDELYHGSFYQAVDWVCIVLVVLSGIMLMRIVRQKLRCPNCRAPVGNPYSGRPLAALVCACCGARLGSDSAATAPKRLRMHH